LLFKRNLYRYVEEAKSEVVHVNKAIASSDTKGRLVHLSGETSGDKISDDDFGVAVPNLVNLRRISEAFQWTEKKHERRIKEGDNTRVETTFTYEKHWKEGVVDSVGRYKLSSAEVKTREVKTGFPKFALFQMQLCAATTRASSATRRATATPTRRSLTVGPARRARWASVGLSLPGVILFTWTILWLSSIEPTVSLLSLPRVICLHRPYSAVIS
jgi:hypothetical protein